jgi:formylglycine-generating enzyme required for sulfatase activity
MKFIFLLLAIFLFSFTSTKREFVPPGTAKYNDTLFMDQTEVSNFAWREFEAWTATKFGRNSPEHLLVLPDTLVWRDKSAYNEPYVQYYYRHPAYQNYPVVGVSYEQVQSYCKWRTEMVKTQLAMHKKYSSMDVEYRLPSKMEWEILSYNGRTELSNNGFNQKGERKFNSVWEPDSLTRIKMKFDTDNADVTAPVYSYWKNFFGLYNMIGNVAEMVSEKGICKGGSWRHRLEQCRTGNDIPYEKPTAWLGFRCVCAVKKSELKK